ncbi:unnamed protein product [Cyprideis torosa]|uniref:Receptor ligand binding region domain-containing protein n=1 Tax=Cyprideis torosa TaxID=163714 RepID=A0A7R8W9Z3_9CRUS|nr:unnamed protein product [Cyprideis torosa]CAG0889032.1 unnamed protein product [Cyprideis torosa]
MSLLGEVVVNPGSPEKLRHGLASLPTEARILFLYCSREEARMVLKEAAVQGLVGANYVWIATRNVIGNMMDAPDEFPTGMLGIHFDTSTSSLIVSISRAVQLFATGLQMYTEDMNSTEITTQALKEAFYPSLSCEASNMKKWTGGSRLFK